MWRRACLGVHDDTVSLFLIWVAGVIDVVLLGASVRGWPWGIVVGTLAAAAAQMAFRLRRRRWDHVIRRQSLVGLAEAEMHLQRRAP